MTDILPNCTIRWTGENCDYDMFTETGFVVFVIIHLVIFPPTTLFLIIYPIYELVKKVGIKYWILIGVFYGGFWSYYIWTQRI